jgi:hypothetical protein
MPRKFLFALSIALAATTSGCATIIDESSQAATPITSSPKQASVKPGPGQNAVPQRPRPTPRATVPTMPTYYDKIR